MADNKQYGVIYLRVAPKKDSPAEWLKYCLIFSALPKNMQYNIKHIADDINTKYADDIVIPMDIMLHPGCTTKPEKVEEIANDIYSQYFDMIERNDIEPCVRCVYSIGELSDVSADSTHRIYKQGGGYDDVMIKVGTTVNQSDEPGLFRI